MLAEHNGAVDTNNAAAAAVNVVLPAFVLASSDAGQRECWRNNNGAGDNDATAAAAAHVGGTTGQGTATTSLPLQRMMTPGHQETSEKTNEEEGKDKAYARRALRTQEWGHK